MQHSDTVLSLFTWNGPWWQNGIYTHNFLQTIPNKKQNKKQPRANAPSTITFYCKNKSKISVNSHLKLEEKKKHTFTVFFGVFPMILKLLFANLYVHCEAQWRLSTRKAWWLWFKSFWKTANITVFANLANVSSSDGRDHKTANITVFVGSENVSCTACHDYKSQMFEVNRLTEFSKLKSVTQLDQNLLTNQEKNENWAILTLPTT